MRKLRRAHRLSALSGPAVAVALAPGGLGASVGPGTLGAFASPVLGNPRCRAHGR